MQKWEYCMLYQFGIEGILGIKPKYWLWKDEDRLDLPVEKTIVVLLNKLGKDGWEAVNFAHTDVAVPTKIDHVGMTNQVLLKRSIEE
jgi:hypothetical protein